MALIELIYFRAGDGHISTAKALRKVLSEKSPTAQVKLVDLQAPSLLGSLDVFGRVTGITGVEIYNRMLRHDLTALDPLYLALTQLNIRLKFSEAVKILRNFWAERQPDLVVSLVPLFNGVILEGLEEALPTSRSLTILTDLCEVGPNYWLEKRSRYVLVPTARAMQQAEEIGLRPPQLRQSSGLVLRPEFYNLPPLNRDAELKILGLNAEYPTLLLFFGGNGSKVMKSILKQLNELGCLMQVICLCGRNIHLKAELEGLETDYPLATIGYSERVSYYMQLADIFIGKPGNISVAEAVHMGLPVITVQNSKTLIQERYTGNWVKDHDYGLVLGCWQDIRDAVSRLTKPGELDRFRYSMKGNKNYGLYEATNFILELADDKHASGSKPTSN